MTFEYDVSIRSNVKINLRGLNLSVSGIGGKRKPILHAIDFQVDTGKMLAIIGPNGAGKSSLLKVILNLVNYDAKTSLIGDHDLRTLGAQKSAEYFAYVPQDIDITEDITVYEWCTMARFRDQFFGFGLTKEDKQVIDDAITVCNLEALKHTSLRILSGGERQRALIAGALAQQAKIMLLDEPTNHLDPAHVLDVLKLLRRLNQERGQTIVCVSHDINQVCQYFDEVYALKQGRCVFHGSVQTQIHVEALFQLYEQRFVEMKSNGERKMRIYFPYDDSA